MPNFQSQGQWENETENIILDKEQLDSLSSKVSVKIKKSSLFIIVASFVAIVAAIIAIYSFARPIEGVWVRQEDDTHVAGMTVEVKCVNGVLQGEIIDMDEGIGTFEVGLIKWYDIKKVGFGQYQLQSLIGIGGSSNTYHYDGTISHITVNRGGKSLSLTTPNSNVTGAFQIWIKQG